MTSRRQRGIGALVTAGVLLVAVPHSATADTQPAAGTPTTVSADPLPTVQVNGVVWQQVTVGNTVFATGSFSTVRPAGAAPGQQEQPMANLVAFDITTGQLLPGFTHSLNAQGMAVAAAPDGTKVYVGGDFTAVDGEQRGHIAAFDTATGALDPDFHPWVNDRVQALSITASTVYAGGQFTQVNGVARKNLAAFTPTGALLDWAPTTNAIVTAMVAVPAQSRVIVGGRFTQLNGTANYGSGSLDAGTGETRPWAINKIVRNNGNNAAIVSLATDGTVVYGSGYSYVNATGSLEGSFAADPATGNVIEINACLGDTYGVSPIGQVLYNVGHAHNCAAIGAFPEGATKRALAHTTYATGVNGSNPGRLANFSGQPAGSLLIWFPDLSIGSYTGQKQAAFSVTGNAEYISLGGEFVAAEGKQQQGLVRYAVSAKAPNKLGPKANTATTPTAAVRNGSEVQLSWQGTSDKDNQNLTYAVRRDDVRTPIYTTTMASTFWQLPAMSFSDTQAPPGQHTYTVTVTDPFGRSFTSAPSAPVTTTATQ